MNHACDGRQLLFDEATSWLLGRFVSAIQPVVPLVSVWAHGSLAGGDYQPGRSDLDLIAILSRPCTGAEEQRLGEVHESLGSASALASMLHCSYCAAGELDDPARLHLTWAHEELMRRRVTPVTRRELFDFGLVLYGGEPAALLPPVTDEQLAEFVVQDMESFWLPSLDHPERWDRDIWVDLGLLTLARATVTLRRQPDHQGPGSVRAYRTRCPGRGRRRHQAAPVRRARSGLTAVDRPPGGADAHLFAARDRTGRSTMAAQHRPIMLRVRAGPVAGRRLATVPGQLRQRPDAPG